MTGLLQTGSAGRPRGLPRRNSRGFRQTPYQAPANPVADVYNAGVGLMNYGKENPLEAGLLAGSAVAPWPLDIPLEAGAAITHYVNHPEDLTWQGGLFDAASVALPFAVPVAGMVKGPKLTKKQYSDVALSNRKKRSKWGEARRTEFQENSGAVSHVRQKRQSNPGPLRVPSVDGLLHYGGGKNRLLGVLAKKHKVVADEKLFSAAKIKADSLRGLDENGLWSKGFADEVSSDLDHWISGGYKYDRSPDSAKHSIVRANLEAVPRALKKEGWTVRHGSKNKAGRKSSRYIVSPDKQFEIRVSDHYLPETPQRQQSTPRWDAEIVLSGNESPQSVIDEIMEIFQEWSE